MTAKQSTRYRAIRWLTASMVLWSSPVAAQSSQDQLGSVAVLTSSTTCSPTSTSFSVGMFGVAQREKDLKQRIKRLESITRLRRHLDLNERQVQMALSIGGGTALRDLITIIDPTIAMSKSHAKHIRKQHQTLRKIWRYKTTTRRATALYDLIYPIISTNAPTPKRG